MTDATAAIIVAALAAVSSTVAAIISWKTDRKATVIHMMVNSERTAMQAELNLLKQSAANVKEAAEVAAKTVLAAAEKAAAVLAEREAKP